MCQHPGIHKVESNFMTSTATVYHDESVTLEEIKHYIAECGYHCSGECTPEHVCKPGDPPAAVSHAGHDVSVHAGHAMPAATAPDAPRAKLDAHAGHTMPTAGIAGASAAKPTTSVDRKTGNATPTAVPSAKPAGKPAAKTDEHAGHDRAAGAEAGEMATMAHEMGHGGSMNMDDMVRDMRNRFLVAFILAIPVFLYSPLFTDYFGLQLPQPFGLSNEILSFLLTTPAVLYGGWVFYVGAWRGLRNGVLNHD